jgi:Mrp family chromosome partitioning ATPase
MRPEGGQEGSGLRDYLRVVRRRKWIIAQAVVLVPLAAVLLSLRQDALYQSSADVLLSRHNIAASLNGVSDPSVYYMPERFAQTQAELARVPALAERVVKASGIETLTPYGFLAASSVAAAPDSDLLRFRVADRDPAIAASLATEYARQYTRYKSEFDTAAIVRAREDVSERLKELAADGERSSPLYQSLAEKEQQLATIEALQTSTAFLIRPAEGAWQIQPKPFRNGVLGLLVGIALGLAFAFLRDALDTRVRSTEEIERLGLPLLARLPEPPRRLRRGNKLAMLAEPNGVQAEAFRMLKTNLEFVNLERGARSILVTSAIQSEGKSTTVANLALAFARAGTRVILVDLDLRRPILHRFFRLRRQAGLTQVALGHAELDEALVPVAVAGTAASADASGNGQANGKGPIVSAGSLHVLGSGPLPPDVGEFVGTKALADILDALSERADLVLVDAPPLLNLGDTRVLCGRVDAMLLVARLSVLRRPMVKELERVLASCPAARLGFVVTGAEQEDGYGYGYGGYDYGGRQRVRAPEEEPVA